MRGGKHWGLVQALGHDTNLGTSLHFPKGTSLHLCHAELSPALCGMNMKYMALLASMHLPSLTLKQDRNELDTEPTTLFLMLRGYRRTYQPIGRHYNEMSVALSELGKLTEFLDISNFVCFSGVDKQWWVSNELSHCQASPVTNSQCTMWHLKEAWLCGHS